MQGVETCSALAFGEMSRLMAAEARRHGLVAPSFRSPPRLAGVTRSVRRYASGHCLVSVQRQGRTPEEVATDMVEGLLVANGLEGAGAEGWRIALRAACFEEQRPAA
jgi:hypothetical protein